MPARLYVDRKKCLLCDSPAELGRKGWCGFHYQRWRKYGDPLVGGRKRRPKGLTETETFTWYMPDDPPPAPSPTEGCWDWAGAVDLHGGYGVFSITTETGKRVIRAHRMSYQIFNGHLIADLAVLHSCDRPVCVQPAHLRLGNDADNHADAL